MRHSAPPARSPNPRRAQWLMKSPRQLDFVFYDLETTGGNPNTSGVTEIAAIKFSKGHEVSRFHTLVNPERHIPRIVQKITGINDDMVRDAPTMATIIQPLLEFIGDAILVSHGAMNDFAFLAHYAQKEAGIELPNFYLCTHLIVSHFLPNIPSKSLSGVANYFSVPFKETHRALADAEMTDQVFWKLCEVLEKSGIYSLFDILKIQADEATLRKLGPGLSEDTIEKVPTTPGVFYLFNSAGEISYVSAASNLRRSISLVTSFGEHREFNRLVVDAAGYKFERTSHFLSALLKEKRELRKLSLPIDPRKLEQRASNFIQIFIPEDMVEFAQSNPHISPFEVPEIDLQKGTYGASDSEDDEDKEDAPGTLTDDERNGYAYMSAETSTSLVPVRHARKSFVEFRSDKYRILRANSTNDTVSIGPLREGVGWCFGPFETPKAAKQAIEKIIEELPFTDESLPMTERFAYLHALILTLYGKADEQIQHLEKEKSSLRVLFSPKLRKHISTRLDDLQYVNQQLGKYQGLLPLRSGLVLVTNNDFKELELVVLIRGQVRKETRISFEDSDKLKSARYFTRLFSAYDAEIQDDCNPLTFDEDICSDIELFTHWLQARRGEGEWVDFRDLEPLYDKTLV